MLTAAIIASIVILILLCICAFLIAAAVKTADDLSDSEAYGDSPFVPRPCDCDFNLPLCDSRCCPPKRVLCTPLGVTCSVPASEHVSSPTLAAPCAGTVSFPDRAGAIVQSPFHTARYNPEDS